MLYDNDHTVTIAELLSNNEFKDDDDDFFKDENYDISISMPRTTPRPTPDWCCVQCPLLNY